MVWSFGGQEMNEVIKADLHFISIYLAIHTKIRAFALKFNGAILALHQVRIPNQ